MWEAATICPAPCKFTFDLLTLKVVSESRVSWATSVLFLVFLGLSVLDLGPMYATELMSDVRQTDVSQYHHRLSPLGGGIISNTLIVRSPYLTVSVSYLITIICSIICTIMWYSYQVPSISSFFD